LVAVTLVLTVSRQSGAVVLAGVVEQLPASVAATTHVLSYQGRLLDPSTGNPKADGAYTMTFRVYDAASGGNTLWTETKDVAVSKGLFSTLLGDTTALDPAVFDGNDRWLGVKVGADAETTPRMRLAFVPYATWARNAGLLNGQDSTFYQNANNINAGTLSPNRFSALDDLNAEGAIGAGAGQVAAGNHNHDAAYVNDDAGEVGNADVPDGALDPAKITGTAWTSANMGAGSGLDADTLDTKHASDFAAASHTHTGADIVDGSINAADLAADSVDSSKIGDGTIVDADIQDTMRYIPITPGDLMHNNSIVTGDCCNGIVFPDAQQTGGPIVFALPNDYVPGTDFSLDLYFIPRTSGAGQAGFFVRWVGLSEGSWSGTGSSATSTLPTVSTVNNIHKQSFTLNAFSAGSLPEIVEMTIRRDPSDSYAGDINLIGIRLAYQASR